MLPGPPPRQCQNCARLFDNPIPGPIVGPKLPSLVTFACEAFPAGLPDDIRFHRVDHTQPVEGDHGLQFTPRAKRWDWPS
jgi:hypothetical protein